MNTDVYQEMITLYSQGARSVLATVVAKKGPTPMGREAKMLLRPDGRIVGTVGGGCTESQVITEGKRTLMDGKSRTLRFTLTEKEVGETGHICGGNVTIFVEPVTAATVEAAQELLRITSQGGAAAVATLITDEEPRALGDQTKIVVHDTGETVGTLPGDVHARVLEAARQVMAAHEPTIVTVPLSEGDRALWPDLPGDSVRVFLEPIQVTPTTYIFGAGHVSFCIARVAKLAGFKVVVTDDRADFANPARFPDADEVIAEDIELACAKMPIDPASYIVIVTRGHQHDEVILEWAVRTPARYIGMIGSKVKVRRQFKHLEARGVPKEVLARVHAPMGLEIDAETPGEIAVSIVAEMIRVRRAKDPTAIGAEVGSKKVVQTTHVAGWV